MFCFFRGTFWGSLAIIRTIVFWRLCLGGDQKDPASSDPACGKVTNRPPMSPNGDSVDPDPIEAKGLEFRV